MKVSRLSCSRLHLPPNSFREFMPGWVCSLLSDPPKLLSSTKSGERIDLHRGDLDCRAGDGLVSFSGRDVPKQAHVNKHCTRPVVVVFIIFDLQRQILSSWFSAENIRLSGDVRLRKCACTGKLISTIKLCWS